MWDRGRREKMSVLDEFVGQFGVLRFCPILVDVTGDINAALLLSQIIFWWEKGRKPFYKYTAPPESMPPQYQKGQSWTEELRMTRAQFETARRRIAGKITAGVSRKEVWDANLVVYWTDSNRLTYYELNEGLLRDRLETLHERSVVTDSGEDEDCKGKDEVKGQSGGENSTLEKDATAEMQHYLEVDENQNYLESQEPIITYHRTPYNTKEIKQGSKSNIQIQDGFKNTGSEDLRSSGPALMGGTGVSSFGLSDKNESILDDSENTFAQDRAQLSKGSLEWKARKWAQRLYNVMQDKGIITNHWMKAYTPFHEGIRQWSQVIQDLILEDGKGGEEVGLTLAWLAETDGGHDALRNMETLTCLRHEAKGRNRIRFDEYHEQAVMDTIKRGWQPSYMKRRTEEVEFVE
jgi:hypothetical protein